MKLWTLFLFISIFHLIYILPPKQELQVIYRNPFLSYQQRLRLKLGSPFYEYIQFLKTNIPADSTVAIPPETRDWGMYGNFLYMKYWLYPRRLTTDISRADYSLIVQSEEAIWPKNRTASQIQTLQTSPLLGFQRLNYD